MVVGEAAVDLGVEQMMLAGQLRRQLLERRAGGAVAGVPADPEGAAVEALQQPLDIAVDHRPRRGPCPRPSSQSPAAAIAAELLDVARRRRRCAEHHLEAVIIGRIVAAGDHDAAVDVELGLGIIEHRRRPEADPDDVDAALGQARDQRRLQRRRAFAPVAADRDAARRRARRTRVPKLRPTA